MYCWKLCDEDDEIYDMFGYYRSGAEFVYTKTTPADGEVFGALDEEENLIGTYTMNEVYEIEVPGYFGYRT